MFRGRLVCVTCRLFFDQKWRLNAPLRNAPFTQRRSRRSLPNASPARCRSGPEPRVAASGATDPSTLPAAARGARTSAVGRGSENTSGDSRGRRRNGVRSTGASALDARRLAEIARSTTSRHATGMATDPAVTIICSPTRREVAASKCCVAHTTQRSPRRRRRRAPRHGGPPSWPTKLRSSRGVS